MSTETPDTKLANRFLILALVATAYSWSVQPAFADVIREVANNTLYSTADPSLRLRIDRNFQYVGNLSFVLKDIAEVDRHHWIIAVDNSVTALVVVQFEGLRDGVADSYQFSIPSADQAAGSNFRFSPDRLLLGGFAFVHNTWAYDNSESIGKNPAADAARTAELLAKLGYVMDDDLIMSRFVTEFGDDHRSELIIFYIEPLARHNLSLDDFPDGGPVSKDFDRLARTMTKRSIGAMEFLERPQ